VVRQFNQINQSEFKCRHVGINDFCIGYSSLSYLRQFPIDDLKIDQSFVCNIATATGDATALSDLMVLVNRLKPVADAHHVVVSADRAQSGSS
jgi:sensor c-di-GMP phosphodiesterase-like protein